MHRFSLYVLFIFFSTNKRVAHGQLSANAYTDIISVPKTKNCNHQYINQTFGIITSPNYPYGYQINTECTWVIIMPEGERVVLTVKKFYVGPKDKLDIIDANDSTSYNLGNDPGDILFSNSNQVVLKLTSSGEEFTGNRSFYSIFEREGCGGLMTQKNGYISVPSYVYMSSTPHECSWTILAPQNKVILLQFLQFDLPPGSCLYSNIYIREGTKEAGYMLGDFCEENPPMNQLRTATNILRISYRTRPNVLAAHTELLPSIKMYFVQEDGCGGVLDGFSGSFTLPLRWLEDVYSCNWTINVPHGKHMMLKFKDWKSLESSFNEYDELKLILPRKNVVYWKSQGKDPPPENMLVPSNSLIVSLTSHRNNSAVTKLRVNCIYQAMAPVEEQCIDIAGREIFICDEWKYIDCSLRCDGVFDCHNKKDEKFCLPNILDGPIAMQHASEGKHLGWTRFFVGLFTITCLIVIIAFLSITADRLCRKKVFHKIEDSSKIIPPNPPPYIKEDRQMHNPSTLSSVPTLCSFTQTCDLRNLGENSNFLSSYNKKYRNEPYSYRSKSSISCNRRPYQDLPKRSTFSLNALQNLRCPQHVNHETACYEHQGMQSRHPSSQSDAISGWESLFCHHESSRHLYNTPQSMNYFCEAQSLSRDEIKTGSLTNGGSTSELLSEKVHAKTLEKVNDQIWSYESDFEECSSTSLSSQHTSIEQLLSSDDEIPELLTTNASAEMFHNADGLGTTNETTSSFSATISREL